jgi:hypothetical protein
VVAPPLAKRNRRRTVPMTTTKTTTMLPTVAVVMVLATRRTWHQDSSRRRSSRFGGSCGRCTIAMVDGWLHMSTDHVTCARHVVLPPSAPRRGECSWFLFTRNTVYICHRPNAKAAKHHTTAHGDGALGMHDLPVLTNGMCGGFVVYGCGWCIKEESRRKNAERAEERRAVRRVGRWCHSRSPPPPRNHSPRTICD